MKKSRLKATIELMLNLAEESWKVGSMICNELVPGGDDDIYELMTRIQEGSISDADECMSALERAGYLTDMEEGTETVPTSVKVNNNLSVEVSTLLNSGSLVSYASGADPEAIGAGIMYRTKNGNEIDIVYVERNTGFIAEAKKLSLEGNDIHVCVYDDPFSEDYTYSHWLKENDVLEAAREEA